MRKGDLLNTFVTGTGRSMKSIKYDDLKVETAAIVDADGKVWTLPRPNRHHDIIRVMRESGYDGPVSHPDQQGFMLNNGMFCRRKPAQSIAENAGQVKNGKIIGYTLTTEDLW